MPDYAQEEVRLENAKEEEEEIVARENTRRCYRNVEKCAERNCVCVREREHKNREKQICKDESRFTCFPPLPLDSKKFICSKIRHVAISIANIYSLDLSNSPCIRQKAFAESEISIVFAKICSAPNLTKSNYICKYRARVHVYKTPARDATLLTITFTRLIYIVFIFIKFTYIYSYTRKPTISECSFNTNVRSTRSSKATQVSDLLRSAGSVQGKTRRKGENPRFVEVKFVAIKKT